MKLLPPLRGAFMTMVSALVCTIMAGFVSSSSAQAASQYCFKYNMTVRTSQSTGAPSLMRWPSYTIPAGQIVNGWVKVALPHPIINPTYNPKKPNSRKYYESGWVMLGPPNEVPCSTSSSPKAGSSSVPKTTSVKKSNDIVGIITDAAKDAVETRQRQIRERQLYLAQLRKDLQMANDAEHKLAGNEYVFCRNAKAKHAGAAGWGCGPSPAVINARIKQLRNRDVRPRNAARPVISAFMKTNLRAKIHERLNYMIANETRGIPAKSWGSKSFNRLRSRAQALADRDVKQWNVLLDEALPALKTQAPLLRQQYPYFKKMSSQYRAILGCERPSEQQMRGATKAGTSAFPTNPALCDKSPLAAYDTQVANWQSTLPLSSNEFAVLGKKLPPRAHELMGLAVKKQAAISMPELARVRKMQQYLPIVKAVQESEGDSQRVVPKLCAAKYAKKHKAQLPQCNQAVQWLLRYDDLYLRASDAALKTYRDTNVCPKPTSFAQVQACSTSVNAAWIDVVNNPKKDESPQARIVGAVSDGWNSDNKILRSAVIALIVGALCGVVLKFRSKRHR